jgi:hypothetical protein
MGKTQPSFVRYSDMMEFTAIGFASAFYGCETAVESTTWGRVKALYR